MTDEEIKEALEICRSFSNQEETSILRLRRLPSEDAFILCARKGWPKALKEIQRLNKEIKFIKSLFNIPHEIVMNDEWFKEKMGYD